MSSCDEDPRLVRARLSREYSRFQATAPLLYDLLLSYGLTWPSLSAQWLPMEPYCTKGAVTHQMLIGTYTSEGFANYIQLANVTLPDSSTADPAEQFMQHPVTAPPPPAAALPASSKRGASAAAAAAAATSTAAAPAASASSAGAVPFFTNGSLRLVHKVRASQELHRIRPFAASFTSDLGRSSLLHPARDSSSSTSDGEGEGEGEGAGARSSHGLGQSRALAAAKGPEQEVKIYNVGGREGRHPTEHMRSATLTNNAHDRRSSDARGGNAVANVRRSVAYISHAFSGGKARERDEALLTLSGHAAGGWPLDWLDGGGGAGAGGGGAGTAAQEGLLVSGDDAGGICVWNLQDAQASALWRLPNTQQNGSSGGGSGGGGGGETVPAAAAANGLMSPSASSPMQRLQALSPPPSASAAAAAASSPVRSGSKAVAVPTLQARWQCASGHRENINDVAWLKQGGSSAASTFLTVGDDRTMKEWDCRMPASASSASAASPVRSTTVHPGGVNSLSTSPFNANLVLTAGVDRIVRLWDRRNMKDLTPVHTFVGHGDSVSQVSWAPFQSSSSCSSEHSGIFASSSKDRRIFIWDASRISDEQEQSARSSNAAAAASQRRPTPSSSSSSARGLSLSDLAESGPSSLLFVHAGHSDLVEDFHWHPLGCGGGGGSSSAAAASSTKWLMASVGSCGENVLQVWKMFEGLAISGGGRAGEDGEEMSEEQLLKELAPFVELLQPDARRNGAAAGASAAAAAAAPNSLDIDALVKAGAKVRHPVAKKLKTALDAAAPSLSAAAQFVVGYEQQLTVQLAQLPPGQLEMLTVLSAAAAPASSSHLLGAKPSSAAGSRKRAASRQSSAGSSSGSSRNSSRSDSSSDSDDRSSSPLHVTIHLTAAASQRRDSKAVSKQQRLAELGAGDAPFSALPPRWQHRLRELQAARAAQKELEQAGRGKAKSKLSQTVRLKLRTAIDNIVRLLPANEEQADSAAAVHAKPAAPSAHAPSSKHGALASTQRPPAAAAAASASIAAFATVKKEATSSDSDSGSDLSSDGELLLPAGSASLAAAAAAKSVKPASSSSSSSSSSAALTPRKRAGADVASSSSAQKSATPSPAKRARHAGASTSAAAASTVSPRRRELLATPDPCSTRALVLSACRFTFARKEVGTDGHMTVHLRKNLPSAIARMQRLLSPARMADRQLKRRMLEARNNSAATAAAAASAKAAESSQAADTPTAVTPPPPAPAAADVASAAKQEAAAQQATDMDLDERKDGGAPTSSATTEQ